MSAALSGNVKVKRRNRTRRADPGAGLESTHRFYYVPQKAEQVLASSNMVEFWVEESKRSAEPGKIVIFEDAEALLMNRGCDSRSQVSSLLNIADGLLGEFFKVHLICTLNCEIEKLDPAIIRPGRLVGIHEFRRLNKEQAAQLAAAKRIHLNDQPDYSLSEIYAPPIIGTTLCDAPRIRGFAA